MIKRIFILLSSVVMFSCSSAPIKMQEAKLSYSYGQLKLFEIDEMSDLVGDRLIKYKKTQNTAFLDEALIIALTRPDNDNILERQLLTIRNSLESNTDWEKAVSRVVGLASGALQDKTTAIQDEIAYTMVLDNLLAEFRAEFNKLDANTQFEGKTIENVAAMNLELSESARKEMQLNSMGALVSPSEIARKQLLEIKALPKSK